ATEDAGFWKQHLHDRRALEEQQQGAET
ncbi:MAG: hypothetical protein DUW69_002735, partial [Verrucomicrobia bacterium]